MSDILMWIAIPYCTVGPFINSSYSSKRGEMVALQNNKDIAIALLCGPVVWMVMGVIMFFEISEKVFDKFTDWLVKL